MKFLKKLLSFRFSFRDSARLNWIIENQIDIDAPSNSEGKTWVLYSNKASLGQGLGSGTDFRATIDRAMKKKSVFESNEKLA